MRTEKQIREEIEETRLALQELKDDPDNEFPDPYKIGVSRGWIDALSWALETEIGGENENREGD